MSRALALVMAGGLSGCNLVFGLELPADDDGDVMPDAAAEPRFGQPAVLTVATPVALTAADLDRDGDADLAIATPDGHSVVVVRCNAQQVCSSTFYTALAPPTAITAFDADRDGLTDVAMVAGMGTAVLVQLNVGGGELASGPSVPAESATQVVGGPIVAGDVSHDLVIAHKGRADLAVYSNNAGGFVPAEGMNAAGAVSDVSTGDISGDGRLDVVVSDEAGVRFFQSTTVVGGFVTFGDVLDRGGSDLLVARIDGDDLLDLVLGTPGALHVWLGDGGGAFHRAPVADLALDANGVRMAAGDLDGDGRGGDVAALASTSGTVFLFHAAADGTLTAGPTVAAGADPSAIALADLDGDRRDDLIVARALAGEVRIWFAR